MIARILLALLFLSIPSSTFAFTDTGLGEGSAATTPSCVTDTYICMCDTGKATEKIYEKTIVTTTACQAQCAADSTSRWALACSSTSGGTAFLGDGSISATKSEVNIEITGNKALIEPNLIVDIPGVEFGNAIGYDDEGNLRTNFLGEYIDGIYRFLIPAMSLIAVVMLMISGMQYMLARGNGEQIKKAKLRMSNAVVGLVLLLAAFNIAYVVNPDFVSLTPLTIKPLDYIELTADSGDTPTSGSAVVPTQENVPTGIKCDPSYTMYDMALSSKGNVTYRLGGKFGNTPPYSDGASKIDANGVRYSTYCPEGQLCMDCSGFSAYLASCAGLPSAGESGGTAGIFNGSAEKITTFTNTTINGEPLVPGDLLGWPTVGSKYGHVVIYVGNGQIAEAHGGTGRKKGEAISTKNTADYLNIFVKKGQVLYVRHRE